LAVTWSEVVDEVLEVAETGCGSVSGFVDGAVNALGDLLVPDADDIDTSTICTEGSEVVEQTLRILEQELRVDARVHGKLKSADGVDARLRVDVVVPEPGNTSFRFDARSLLAFPD
jgi:hypothetical protein